MRMKIFAVALAATLLVAGAAHARDPLTLQLKWVAQAQFAGYYVAKAKGFYESVDLEVTILPGGPEIAPSQVIAAGRADVIVEWMPAALAAREHGVPLVNIAQLFSHSGMMLTCRKDSGIRSTKSLKGHTLGVWYSGNEYPFLAWMSRLGLKVSGPRPDVRVVKQGFDVEPLLRKQADCISTMTYNEYWQVIDGGLKPADLVTFRYQDAGVATLEDGLYTTEGRLGERGMPDRLARFVAASTRGWAYAIKNQGEAVEIVLKADPTRPQDRAVQGRMLGEVAKLIHDHRGKGLGYLDPAAYQRTVTTLLVGASDPVISRKPKGAWTHAVWEAARTYRK
jgi:NitT/TauT family transport system substrate-binding protein